MANKNIDSIGKLEADVSRLNSWMIGVIIVLGIAFAAVFVSLGAILVDSSAKKESTYLDLRDKIKEQNDKIDALTTELKAKK